MRVARAMRGFFEEKALSASPPTGETLRALESCRAAARMELRSFEGRMLGHERHMDRPTS
jgi:hypothetical protein